MDSVEWGYLSKYGKNTAIAHFVTDGNTALEFQNRGRKLGKTVLVEQVTGRSGLTVFIVDVTLSDFIKLVNDLPRN